MWIMALFDLPVGTPGERKRATGFRNRLLDLGFEMVQFSVYARFTSGQERVEALTREIGELVPKGGKVDVLYFTDKQYEKIVSFRSETHGTKPEKSGQLSLF
ncbi:MAG: CRISPR-associated endonuclease Cas2 [Hyphomonadaceae bacterium]|nr:CRISPR-associated endonuclease Cas2 [Hyphomonadaceae bacterium]